MSTAEIEEARRRDADERTALRSRIVGALQPLMEAPDSVDGQRAIDLLQELHHLIELTLQCDQGFDQEVEALHEGHKRLSEALRLARGPEHAAQLDAVARTLANQVTLLRSPLLATLSRADSPLRHDELVPAILGLKVSEVRQCLEGIRALDDGSLRATASDAIQLMRVALDNGVDISDAEDKRHAFERFVEDRNGPGL